VEQKAIIFEEPELKVLGQLEELTGSGGGWFSDMFSLWMA